jgi:hypothetical protein
MEPLHLQVYFFTVPGQQRREFVNYDPRGQSIVGRRVIDLFTLPLDPIEFPLKSPGSTTEPLSTGQATLIKLGVAPSPASSSEPLEPLCRSHGESCLFPAVLSSSHASLSAQAISASTTRAISSLIWSMGGGGEDLSISIRVGLQQRPIDQIYCNSAVDLTVVTTISREIRLGFPPTC